MILDIIKKTIREYNLIKTGDSILIGLSGGADSVCLTHALWSLKDELDIRLCTAHINHGIRGDEAERDEEFVKKFSNSLGIKCFVNHANIPKLSKDMGISEEMAGRKVRYDFFDELCEKYNINKIATAHNKNDSAETLLMNFMRGSSINGLCGIPYQRGNIIRPVLNITRDEIESYCKDNNLQYITDSTNLTDDYTRNKIRHSLIPFIQKEFNSNFVNTVTDNAVLVKEDSDYMDKIAMGFYQSNVTGGIVSIKAMLSVDISIRRRVIRYMLKDIYNGLSDISSIYVSDIIKLIEKTGVKQISLFGEVIAKSEYGKLIIEHKKEEIQPFVCEIGIGETISIEEINKVVSVSIVDKRQNNNNAIYLSADVDKIVIRSKKNGDKFYPVGITGSKKIKEYFIDKKVPKDMRNSVPIIEINGEIAAVGNRVDRRFTFQNNGIRIDFKDI